MYKSEISIGLIESAIKKMQERYDKVRNRDKKLPAQRIGVELITVSKEKIKVERNITVKDSRVGEYEKTVTRKVFLRDEISTSYRGRDPRDTVDMWDDMREALKRFFNNSIRYETIDHENDPVLMNYFFVFYREP